MILQKLLALYCSFSCVITKDGVCSFTKFSFSLKLLIVFPSEIEKVPSGQKEAFEIFKNKFVNRVSSLKVLPKENCKVKHKT